MRKDDVKCSTVDLEDGVNTKERSTIGQGRWKLLQQGPKPVKVKAKGKNAARIL